MANYHLVFRDSKGCITGSETVECLWEHQAIDTVYRRIEHILDEVWHEGAQICLIGSRPEALDKPV